MFALQKFVPLSVVASSMPEPTLAPLRTSEKESSDDSTLPKVGLILHTTLLHCPAGLFGQIILKLLISSGCV